MNRSLLTAVCLWLCSGWCCGAPAAGPLPTHRRPVVESHPMSLVATQHPGRSRGFASQQQLQKKSAVAAVGTTVSVAPEDSAQPADQDAADTVGFNFGLGFGLDTPLIDSLLERLIRRKQFLMAAAAAAYPGAGGWGVGAGGGGGYFPGPAVVFPYGGGGGGGGVGGGGGGGGILPWNRPATYPFPFVPSLNGLNPFGGGGGGGGVGGSGWGGFGGGGIGGGGWGGGGWGGGWGGFNPLFDFDDFGWKNNNAQQ